jgi:hypothetical protein
MGPQFVLDDVVGSLLCIPGRLERMKQEIHGAREGEPTPQMVECVCYLDRIILAIRDYEQFLTRAKEESRDPSHP